MNTKNTTAANTNAAPAEVVELTPAQMAERVKQLAVEKDKLVKEEEVLLGKLRTGDLHTARALVKTHGFTAAELGIVSAAPAAPAKAATPPTYQDGTNTCNGEVYLNTEKKLAKKGKGAMPKWVQEKFDAMEAVPNETPDARFDRFKVIMDGLRIKA